MTNITREGIVREGIVPTSEVIPYIVSGEPPHGKANQLVRRKRIYLDKPISMDGRRLQTFLTSGLVCVSCQLPGAYFAVEKRDKEDHYTLNLYGLDGTREIFFTKDHILPTSLGGNNEIYNLQTMCSPCNHRKGNGIEKGTGVNCDHRRNIKKTRIKKIRCRINAWIRKINDQAKLVYKEGPGINDGGPDYRRLRQRRALLLLRAKKLDQIESGGARRAARLLFTEEARIISEVRGPTF